MLGSLVKKSKQNTCAQKKVLNLSAKLIFCLLIKFIE